MYSQGVEEAINYIAEHADRKGGTKEAARKRIRSALREAIKRKQIPSPHKLTAKDVFGWARWDHRYPELLETQKYPKCPSVFVNPIPTIVWTLNSVTIKGGIRHPEKLEELPAFIQEHQTLLTEAYRRIAELEAEVVALSNGELKANKYQKDIKQ